ncbi:hypothetical protein RUM43_001814 [Polyplax serrata]|uniref:DNA polymerase delta subunit 2 n=1 Tax=Polyplax serrata TaxID=468196 RepID=A0AAN8XUL4_POLSC
MILENKSKGANPFTDEINTEVTLTRSVVQYENLSQRFVCLKRDFKRQFAHIYACRLKSMKESVIQSSVAKWGKNIPIRKLTDLTEENDEKCIVIGTLFKHQELKPSILKEISEEQQVTPQPVISNFMSENDELVLEDEMQRIKLEGNINVKKMITGIVVALLGFETSDGKFVVEDVCFAGANAYPEKPLPLAENSYMLLVSGLNVKASHNILALELLTDWIKGEFGSIADQRNSAKVCRVVIAGNSVGCSDSSTGTYVVNTDLEEEIGTLNAIQQLDEALADMAGTVEVDIMPGECDPSNHIIPQQPFYDCVFPKASAYASFQPVTNPYECSVAGIRLLGTSGQPVDNIKAFSDFDDSLDILENTLMWGHLAPSAPDTLGCYPYYNEDPFIITHQPHIYFVGNQKEYKTKTVISNGLKTQLISVPTFYNTQTCVLISLNNLESTPLTFKV